MFECVDGHLDFQWMMKHLLYDTHILQLWWEKHRYKNWISLFVRSFTVCSREEHSLSSRALRILHSFFIHSLILLPLLAQLHSCSQSIEIEIFKDSSQAENTREGEPVASGPFDQIRL